MTEQRKEEEIDRPEETADRSGAGAESYGGDPDAEPSVTEEDVERGVSRDQAEG